MNDAGNPERGAEYRPEIDGLRAVAVLAVMFYHGNLLGFYGGFVGVDVFFVISGFLITKVILADQAAGRFSITAFYERRIRRLLPALYVVLICSTPIAWAVLTPTDMLSFARSLMAVPVFGSNFIFWREAGYFDTAAELKPLLHTWSLAVEEQFYAFFPLVLLLCDARRRRLLPALIVTTLLASLLLCVWGTYNKPDATFYLLPTRAWELLTGSFIAALRLDERSKRVRPSWARDWGAGLGMLLIALSIVTFDEDIPWPGVHAPITVAGTALLLVLATGETRTGRLLASRPLVVVGLISYSAYLWHQPIFAFARHVTIQKLSEQTSWLLVSITLGLAYLTWRYVEQPIRARQRIANRERMFVLAASTTAAIVAVGAIVGNSTYLESTLGAKERAIYSYLDYRTRAEYVEDWRPGVCFLVTGFESAEQFDRTRCLASTRPGKRYLLIGDSHAAHLYTGLRDAFPDANILQLTASGCRPTLDPKGEPRCVELMSLAFHELLTPPHTIDAVILSGRWRDETPAELRSTLAFLAQRVDRVILLGPPLEYEKPLPLLLVRYFQDQDSIPFSPNRLLSSERISLDRMLDETLQSTSAEYYSLISAQCPAETCSALTESGVPIAFDRYGHFTRDGSRFVAERLKTTQGLTLR